MALPSRVLPRSLPSKQSCSPPPPFFSSPSLVRLGQDAHLLRLELDQLLLPVSLDDERDDQNEESRRKDPGRLASAPEQLQEAGGTKRRRR